MPSAKFYVYVYCDPRTKIPFYVGKGTGFRSRRHLLDCLKEHGRFYGNHFYRKLRKLLREGVSPQIVKVFEGGERQCHQTEQTLIASYGRKCDGGPLCNYTTGGEGFKHSEETKKHLSKVRHTKEWNAKISKTLKGRPATLQRTQAAYEASRCPVEAFDIGTGEILHTFESQMEAEKSGFHHIGISHTITGRQRTHRGLGWRRKDA